jgi:hypothetical protein
VGLLLEGLRRHYFWGPYFWIFFSIFLRLPKGQFSPKMTHFFLKTGGSSEKVGCFSSPPTKHKTLVKRKGTKIPFFVTKNEVRFRDFFAPIYPNCRLKISNIFNYFKSPQKPLCNRPKMFQIVAYKVVLETQKR